MVQNFLAACAVADLGHIYVTYAVMEWQDCMDVVHWNAMAWGNIGVTAGLFATRCLYLAGAFGEDRVEEKERRAVKKTV